MREVALGDLIEPSKMRRAGSEIYPILSMTMHEGLVDQSAKFKKRVASNDLSGYKVVTKGQLVVGFPIDEGVLDFQILYDAGIVSPAYGVWDLTDASRIHIPYLKRFLRSSRALTYYKAKLRGSTARRRSLPAELFLALPVPLPTVKEQRRIAGILDQADAILANRHQVLVHLDTLTQSLFHDMFGKESWRAVTPAPQKPNEHGWQWELLDGVARLATGHTPDRKCDEYWNGSIPWISLPDIRSLDGHEANETSLYVTEAGIRNSSAVVLPSGTVCFSRTASVGFVTKMGRQMATSQDFHNWVPGPGLNPEYLMAALRFSRSHLLGATDGSTHKTIYQRTAKTFRVLLPPRELQDRFATRIGQINAQRVVVRRALDADNELFASLQAWAFRGEL